MAGSSSYNARRPSPGSLLDRWLTNQTPHADSFDCGIKVVSGTVAREGTRWRFRRSAVDPLLVDGVVSLNHGTQTTLHLIVGSEPPDFSRKGTPRYGFARFSAVERDSGARVEVSVPQDELERFGIELL